MRPSERSAIQLIAVVLFASGSSAQQWSGSEHVFGSLLGETITYRSPSRLAAEASLATTGGGQPPAVPDEAALAGAQERIECAIITAQIRAAVLSELVRREDISVSDAEVEEEKRTGLQPIQLEAAAEKQQAVDLAMSEALSLVYDHGESPDAVFGSLLAAKGYSSAMWQSYLIQGKDPSFRNRLSQAAAFPPRVSDRASTDGARLTLEHRKLDDAVDRNLAADDPQFKAYLGEMQASQAAHADHRAFTMKAAHYRYMKAKRDAWWKARYAEIDLSVRDKEKADRCGIAALGMQLHYEN